MSSKDESAAHQPSSPSTCRVEPLPASNYSALYWWNHLCENKLRRIPQTENASLRVLQRPVTTVSLQSSAYYPPCVPLFTISVTSVSLPFVSLRGLFHKTNVSLSLAAKPQASCS